ncbi:hypothetical protein D3C72_96940 [compost metagenome]
MDLPFLNTSPSPEGSDGGDDATLNDLLALYQSANDVPPPFAPLADSEAFPAAPAAPELDFAAPSMDFAAPAPMSPDAEIDDLIKSFQDAAPAPFEPPPFATPEAFAAPVAPDLPFAAPDVPEPPFAAAPADVAIDPPPFAAPDFPAPDFPAPSMDFDAPAADFSAPAAEFDLEAFAAPAVPEPLAAMEAPAAEEPAFMVPEPAFMDSASELEALVDEVALQPAFAPEPEPVFAPEPEAVFVPEPEAVFVPEPEVAPEPVFAPEPPAASVAPVVSEAPVAPAPVAEEIRTVVPAAAPAVAMEISPFTGDLPSLASPAERQAVNRGVLESLSQIATGIDQVQNELNGLYENLAQAASHRASVGEIVTLTERLTAVKGEVGENSALYQQALQLRAVAEAYMQLLKNL